MEISSTKGYGALLKFLIPSSLGILLFMVPILVDGAYTIPVALLSKILTLKIAGFLPTIVLGIILLSAIGAVAASIYNVMKPQAPLTNPMVVRFFVVTPPWFMARVAGAILALCTYLSVGPVAIISEDTGGLMFNGLLTSLFAVFLFAGFLLPLLTDFGLLELVGAMTSKLMRPVFQLPGRSAIDCITSWVGDGTIGVLLTNKQYEDGFYTAKEAAIIGTTFSAVSITFSLVVLAQVRLEHLFLPYYLTIMAVGVVAAIIMPRLAPLKGKANAYIETAEAANISHAENELTLTFTDGLDLAKEKANKACDFKRTGLAGAMNVLDMWLGVMPVVMAIGTAALLLAEYTPIFAWLGTPLVPVLKVLAIPEAGFAAQTLVVGFADMFLPSVIASTITSDLTRFVIAGVSVCQLIYLSEVGGLLLSSSIPVTFMDLLKIFILRTLIALPIFAAVAHILF